jgi:Uri superfamily endonuclease
MDDLPHQPGTYALILELSEPRLLDVGRLGRFKFPAGFYVYLGSARGPGGIQARLGRHLRWGGKLHWHIDHLRIEAETRGYGYILDRSEPDLALTECDLFQKLAAIPNAGIPIPKFGASDCQSGCLAHLIHFRVRPEEGEMQKTLSEISGVLSDEITLRLVAT